MKEETKATQERKMIRKAIKALIIKLFRLVDKLERRFDEDGN